jgi:large conductance mechanosensitive channel
MRIGAVAIGNFIQASVNFLIIAFAIFLIIQVINKFKQKEEIKKCRDF